MTVSLIGLRLTGRLGLRLVGGRGCCRAGLFRARRLGSSLALPGSRRPLTQATAPVMPAWASVVDQSLIRTRWPTWNSAINGPLVRVTRAGGEWESPAPPGIETTCFPNDNLGVLCPRFRAQ